MIINKTFIALITSLSLTTIEWLCFKILIDYMSNQKTSKKIRFISFLVCVLVSVLSTNSLKPLVYIIAGFFFYKPIIQKPYLNQLLLHLYFGY